MLATIIPGVREIRAPLAAGFVWILSGWILWSESVPSEGSWAEVFQRSSKLLSTTSSVGAGIALGFSAYLTGILLERLRIHRILVAPSIYLSVLSRQRESLVGRLRLVAELRSWNMAYLSAEEDPDERLLAEAFSSRTLHVDVELALRDLVLDALDGSQASEGLTQKQIEYLVRRAIRGAKLTDGEQAFSEGSQRLSRTVAIFAAGMLESLSLIELRMLGESERYSGEIDRIRSEGKFRLGLVDPLLFLLASLTYLTLNLGILFLLVVPYILYKDGEAKDAQATAATLAAVRGGALDPPPSPVEHMTNELRRA